MMLKIVWLNAEGFSGTEFLLWNTYA